MPDFTISGSRTPVTISGPRNDLSFSLGGAGAEAGVAVALAHVARTDNPHGVTPAQIGALTDSNAAFTARFKAWMASLPTTPTAVGEPYNMGGIPAIAQP